MKNKSKLTLSLFTGLTTLSVATPLATSCAKTNKLINHVHESEEDKLYGINANTYESLKKDYVNQFQDDMLERGYIEGSDEWRNKMSNLNYSLQIFDDKSKTINMSYGELTSSLMNYAKTTNHLTLHRTTNAKPSDVDNMYQGARNSFDLYMDQLGFSSILKTQVLNDADKKFVALKTQLQEKGTMENDPYGALQEAKSSLMGFFELINAKISRFGSMTTLSNFRKKYTLVYKDSTYLNNLLNNPEFALETPLSENIMNQIFDCIDVETGSRVNFKPNIMTGYVLTPTLKAVSINNKTNKHQIDIQWSCISNTYIDSNDAETIDTATAYEYEEDDTKFNQVLKLENPTIDQVFDSLKAKPVATNAIFSVDREKSNLKRAYFDPNIEESIVFKMPDASDKHAKLDPFYMSSHGIYTDDEGVTHDGELSTTSLAQTGIMISDDKGKTFKYLSDVLESTAAEDFTWEKATLAQQFVIGAEINAKVHEIDKNTHKISIELWAKYKNSSFAKDEIDPSSWEYVSTTSCSGYPISEEKFQEFSKDYSAAYEYVDMYRSKKIKLPVASLILRTVVTSISIVVLSTSVFKHCSALFKIIWEKNAKLFKYIPWIVLGIITGLFAVGLLGYATVVFIQRIDEAINFEDALDKFINTDEIKTLFQKLDDDANVFVKYSPLTDEFAESNDEYKAKYENFKNGDIAKYIKLDNYYKSVPREDGFVNTLAKKMPVDVSKNAYTDIVNRMSSKDHNISLANMFIIVSDLLLLPITLSTRIASNKAFSSDIGGVEVIDFDEQEEAVVNLIESKEVEQTQNRALELSDEVCTMVASIFNLQFSINLIANLLLLKDLPLSSRQQWQQKMAEKLNLRQNMIRALDESCNLDYDLVLADAKAQRPDLFQKS